MGELWVVATPIGHLGDMSERMKDALRDADLIAAEDTRVTMKLLSHMGISKHMVSCHRHNERQKAPDLIRRIVEEDINVALTSDAGTPGISDPGFELVRLAHEMGVRVVPVCGPSAAVAALSASGFDAREFTFYGFLPREKKPLREKLREIGGGTKVGVLYESPHRVLELMRTIASELPGAVACVCCDITKRYESILVGEPGALATQMAANPNVAKGEYVVVLDLSEVIQPEKPASPAAQGADAHMVLAMLAGATLAEAAEMAASSGFVRNEIYRAKLRIKAHFAGLWD